MPIGAMATSSRALRRLVAPPVLDGGRFLSTSSRLFPAGPTSASARPSLSPRLILRPGVSRVSWRCYADAPAPKPKRRFRVLRWTWRLTYLSVLGGVAYVGYGVYLDRHPAPQSEPDPSKKTLVILGKLPSLRASKSLELSGFLNLSGALLLNES